jgi:hypothetical protein
MKRAVYEDAHVSITVDDAGLVRYVRTQQPYTSLEALRAVHDKVRAALDTLPSGKLALLVDVREAKARNDDPFETEIMRALQAITGRFTAYAVLVKSAVGRLQAQRLAKPRRTSGPSVFGDEEEALSYLRKSLTAPRTPR